MALFVIEGHAGAAGFSATPNPMQWTVDEDPDARRIEIENAGAQEQTCQLLISNVTGGRHNAVSPILQLKSDLAEITMLPRQRGAVKLKLQGGLRCPAGLYHATLTLKPRFGPGAETIIPIQIRIPPRLMVSVDRAPLDIERRPGGFDVMARFYVEASAPNVQCYVTASPLAYQGESRGSMLPVPLKPPIPLDLSQPVEIIPQHGGPGGAASRAYFRSPGEAAVPFHMQATEPVVLSAGEGTYFAQPVYVTLHWKWSDPHQAVGTYVGQVQLNAMVMPE